MRTWRMIHGLLLRRDEVELYGLNREGRDPTDFIGYNVYEAVIRPALNDERSRVLTDNKWVFYRHVAPYGIPIPETLALLDQRYGMTWDGLPCTRVEQLEEILREKRPRTLVIKPAGGIQGQSVLVYNEIDHETGLARSATGQTEDYLQAIRRLPTVELRGGSGWVVQTQVKQHPRLATINPHTSNTVRVVTHVKDDGAIQVPFSVVRFGRLGNMVDNWAHGGISVGICVANGEMGRGIIKPKHGGRWVEAHPDTAIGFAGTKVPKWNETVELCKRAARLFPGVRSIGWDVIVTDEGPVILEANEEWDLIMVQVHTDGWLAQDGVRSDFESLGIDLPREVPGALKTVRQIAARKARRLTVQLAAMSNAGR